MRQKGFTMIELVLVISILSILAVSAFPRFMDISLQAEQAVRDGVVGAVRSGIVIYRANDYVISGPPGTYPVALDSVSDGSACNDCFSEILQHGIDDVSWTKNNDTHYSFNDGSNSTSYIYDPNNGTFE